MTARQQTIVLVHGTILLPWLMSRPQWMSGDHAFGESVRRDIPGANVIEFGWRGGNLHRDRLIAAESLASQLRELSGRVVIVAHSHGGNVARCAVKKLKPTERANVRLLTLGTPFLNVRRHHPPYGPLLRWQNWVTLVFALAVGLTVLTGMDQLGLDFKGGLLGTSFLSTEDLDGVWAFLAELGSNMWLPSLVFGCVVAVVLLTLRIVGGAILRGVSNGGIDEALHAIDTRSITDVPHTVVGVENDEAAWALNLGQIAGSSGAALGSTVGGYTLAYRFRSGILGLASFALIWGFLEGEDRSLHAITDEYAETLWFLATGGWTDELSIAVGAFLVVSSLAGFAGMLIHVGEYLSTGWDALAFAPEARISTSPMAPGLNPTLLLDTDSPRLQLGARGSPLRRRLRHSEIYENAEAAKILAKHIQRSAHQA